MGPFWLFLTVFAMAGIFCFLGFALWRLEGHLRTKSQSQTDSLERLGKEMTAWKDALHRQMMEMTRHIGEQHEKNSRFLMESHKEYADSVEKVQHRLGELQTVAVTMLDISKDISSLQDILRAPKLRGQVSELWLGELLRQILPQEHYRLQYEFQNGSKVDAVILLGEGMVPVDAKFPLENFKRILAEKNEELARAARRQFIQDVKKHVDSIASKYILPQEGTFEFALMYIPAENVYYETIIKEDAEAESLSQYAIRKKVIPVSPNSFYAYLQAIVRGLRGLRIEQSAQKILENLGQLEADFRKILGEFEKVGGHLSNALSAYERTTKGMEKLQLRLSVMEERQEADTDLGSVPLLEPKP